jgi:hypothetical protein
MCHVRSCGLNSHLMIYVHLHDRIKCTNGLCQLDYRLRLIEMKLFYVEVRFSPGRLWTESLSKRDLDNEIIR